jgi:hypothetical protein
MKKLWKDLKTKIRELFAGGAKYRPRPDYKTVGRLFWGCYESQKQIDLMNAFIIKNHDSCYPLPEPSKDIKKTYGIRGKSEYWIIWYAIEYYVNSNQSKKDGLH